MKLRNWDLLLVVLLTVVAALTAYFQLPLGLLRSLPALALLLVLPGYALTIALFHQRTLEGPIRLLWSIGISLSLAALSGVLLNWSGGLQPHDFATLLGGFTLVATALAFLRRQLSGDSGPTLAVRGIRQVIMIGIALAITIGAFGVARIGAQDARYVPVTQLWLLPRAEAGPHALTLGVHSLEAQSTNYRLQLKAGEKVIQEWNSLTLAPGATWQQDMTLTTDQTDQGPITADLYRSDTPNQIYRHASWEAGS